MLIARLTIVLLVIAMTATVAGSNRRQSDLVPVRRITNTNELNVSLNPSISGDGRAIAFESNADLAKTGTPTQIRAFRASLDSEPPVFVQLGVTRAVTPALSEAGSAIAFASYDNPIGSNSDGNSEVFFFDGVSLSQVTNTTPGDPSQRPENGNFQPSISDDGRLIAFSSNRNLSGANSDENLEVFIFDTASTQFIQITNSTNVVGATAARISGDGSRIAYVFDSGKEESEDRELHLLELSTGSVQIVAGSIHHLRLTSGRAISDDGLRIVYSGEPEVHASQVYLYDGRNDLTRQLTVLGVRTVDVQLNPTISGDGKRVAFATRRNVIGGNSDSSVELYTLDLPTSRVVRVTSAPSAATAEVISSLNDDGSTIVFNFPRVLSGPVEDEDDSNNSEIYTAPIDDREPLGSLSAILNGASLGHEPGSPKAIAPDSVAVANGSSLSIVEEQALQLPDGSYPTVVVGTSVTINGLDAQIFGVSPTRISFLLPKQIGQGFAEVVVTNGDGYRTRGTVRVLRAAPGIFTVSGDGTGEGEIVDADTGLPGPFDPTDGTNSVVINATGVRGQPQQLSVRCGNRLLPVDSIEPSTNRPGVDRIRVGLPADLRGTGVSTLVLSVNRRESNPVSIVFTGDFARDVRINEVLADPPDGPAGDANHDGIRNGAEDEFIELVNAQDDAVNISGWVIRTRAIGSATETTRHVFASGSVLSTRDALVIFGGGVLSQSNPVFGGAQVIRSSSASGLSLTNGGLTILLRDAAGHIIAEMAYGGETGLDGNADQSLTRTPDIDGGYVVHLNAAASNGRRFSPGTLVDGEFFVPREPYLNTISIAPALATSVAGRAILITSAAFDQFDRPIRRANFTFTSDDPDIASVDSVRIDRRRGVATARVICRSSGNSLIRATAIYGASSITSTPSQITVTPPPPVVDHIEITPAIRTLNRGAAAQFTAHAYDAGGRPVSGVAFTWSSSAPLICAIDQTGSATGVGVGRVTILATADNGMEGTVSGERTIDVAVPVVINEILADVPPDNTATPDIEGDANRDGIRNSDDDEFIELVNTSYQPVDVSGIVVADSTSNRYTFPSQTILPPGRVVIIFGGGAPPINDPAFGGALVLATASLGLNDGGDSVRLKLSVGGEDVTIAEVAFGATTSTPAPSNQSLTRSPDSDIETAGGDLVPHTTAIDAATRVFSPGTRTSGTPFGSPAIARLEVDPTTASIEIGEIKGFIGRAFANVNGEEIQVQNVCFIWDTSDPTKASITPGTGTITTATGVAAGSVIVRARAGGMEAVASLVVIPPPPVLTRIEVTPMSASVLVGQTRQFNARAFDQFDQEIPGVAFTWESSDATVATIDSNGLASGLGSGQTGIRASSAGISSSSATLTVVASIPVPASGQIIINEALVAFATSTTQARADFIELYNTTGQVLDLSGLVISLRPGGAGNNVATVTLPGAPASGTTLIQPNSYFLIVNGPATFGVMADFDASQIGFDLNNTTGGIKIEIAGVKLDGLSYQGGASPPAQPFITFGEGTLLVFSSGTTNDLIRSPNATDTDDNSHDFRRNGTVASVTPRAANP